ncbi:putative F-box/LRR-repeat protein 9 [Arachis hypogaea]|uniref:putative F-box/LRR-repeat protein 9 n=1 Tax=Arachis hypogaea TaxID=3818 RepID=UPI0010FC54C1|nr:putative F-box/LRR-repeat protein 22 [Arachis hypogaea]
MDYQSINAGPEKKVNWLDLPHDLTLMIIGKLATFEILISTQFVCPKWRRICMDPLLWRTINMCDIGIRNSVDYKLEKMCRHAIDRSCGHLIDISIEHFGTDDLLKYIIDSGCHKLRHLRLVQCFYGISDKGLCEIAEKLPLLEELDITLCSGVSSIALEAIGRGCPLLKSFKYNNNGGDNEEALAIAQNMSNLHHLQLVRNYLDNSGLSAILDGCPHLESLDLRLCHDVELEGELRTRCDEQLKDLRDPNAPLDDFKFCGLCFEIAYDDAVFDYLNEKRVQEQEYSEIASDDTIYEYQKREAERVEKENLDEADWEEIYAIWESNVYFIGLISSLMENKAIFEVLG